MTQSTVSLYYRKNPKVAFQEGFVDVLECCTVNSQFYYEHHFFLPRACVKKANFLHKYFLYIDSLPEPQFRRRQSWHEWGGLAELMLLRVDSFLRRKQTFVAGSASICILPWAIFGETERLSQYNFKSMEDICRHYRNFLHGDCRTVKVYLKKTNNFFQHIADRYDQTSNMMHSPNLWLGVAICLIYDFVHNCGPDCAPLLELFTNDYTIGVGEMDNLDWHFLRAKILGVDSRSFKHCNQPQIRYLPYRPEKFKAEITMLEVKHNDLSLGEKTVPTKLPMLALAAPQHKHQERLEHQWTESPYDMRDVYQRMKYGRGIMHGPPEFM